MRLFHALCALVLCAANAAHAQTINLSPAVVSLAGQPGQGTTQVLTMRNDSDIELDFVMEARDVIVRDGKRVIVDPVTLQDSIAGSAIFVPKTIRVAPRSTGTVSVTFTLPHGMRHRAAIAYFQGRTLIKSGGRDARASLGTLFTFAVSDRASVASAALEAVPPTAEAGAQLKTRMVNDGTEPVVAAGAAAIVDEHGRLVGKVPFTPTRLLPGEARTLVAEYPGELSPGSYRAVATFEVAGRPLTQTAVLTVK